MLDKNDVTSLFRKGEIFDPVLNLEMIASGGNNQTYHVFSERSSYIVKYYFRHQDDLRDRLSSEYLFLQHCGKTASKWTPIPLAADFEKGIALYEFIGGRKVEEKDLNLTVINQATEFFVTLNQISSRDSAKALPLASEACFSIKDHLDLVTSRILKLEAIDSGDQEGSGAKSLVSEINAEMVTVSNLIQEDAQKHNDDIHAPLTEENRCISPSDFGFHNAILKEDGSIIFIDFEYAGWDDPAKMVGDFFSQLAVPVPDIYFESFLREVMTPFADPGSLIRRARYLKPVYQIKWFCIALNIFLPVHLMRRKHSNPNLNAKELKKAQISKAESILAAIRKTKYVLC